MAVVPTPDLQASFAPIHRLAVRHRPSPLSDAERQMIDRDLVSAVGPGWVLTFAGYRAHRSLIEAERSVIDVSGLDVSSGALAALERRLADIRRAAGPDPTTVPEPLLTGVFVFAAAAELAFLRLGGLLSRLGSYAGAIREAARRLGAGDLRYGLDPHLDSIATVWDDGYEDFLQTVGRGREAAAL